MMRATRRLMVVLVVLALPMAMVVAAGAKPPKCDTDPDLPGCPTATTTSTTTIPAGSVDVTVEQHLRWVHEAGDEIIYTITVANGSGEPVDVTDSLTNQIDSVPPGPEVMLERSYFVDLNDVEWEDPDQELGFVTNTVAATGSGGVVAGDSVVAEFTPYELCDVNNPPFTIGTWACIWKPVMPGTYTIVITPEDSFDRPRNVGITIRDHIPGNWCGVISDKWNPSKNPNPSLALEVTVPQPVPLLDPWIGLQPECDQGGAGGDFFTHGTSGSFYLTAGGEVTITEGTG